jgi:HEAT repeat protein
VIFLHSFPTRLLFLTVAWCLFTTNGIAPAAQPAGPDGLKEAQAAFNKQQYDQALQLLESLEKGGKVTPDVRRLKIKTLAKSGKPLDALAEYDVVTQAAKKDDPPLLREVAFGFIVPLLKDMRDQMRGAGYTALGEIDSEETVPYFEDGLSDGSGMVRALAVKGLGQLKAGQRSPRLKNALQDQAAYVRKYAVQALGKTGDRAMAGLIEKSLDDEEPLVRVSAAGALAMLNQPQGWTRLRESGQSNNPEESGAALRMLGLLKDAKSFPALEAALGHSQPSVRAAAAAGLGNLGEKKSWPALVKALHDPIPVVRGAAVISLGKLQYRDALPALKQSLSDQNPGVRADAVEVLLELGVPYDEVAGTVRELKDDSSPRVRDRVAKSLVKARGKSVQDAIGTLQLLLQDPLPLPRMMAARALGHIKSEQTGSLLKQALHDQDEAVRATAAGALIRWLDGKVGIGKGDPIEG